MDPQLLIAAFLALPSEAIPSATGSSTDDEPSAIWRYLRARHNGDRFASILESRVVTLRADRPEWREGVRITV